MSARILLDALRDAADTHEASVRYRGHNVDIVATSQGTDIMVGDHGSMRPGREYVALLRDIDTIIDILDEREPTGFEDAAINPELAHHVTLRVTMHGLIYWLDPNGNEVRQELYQDVESTYIDHQITPGDFLALLRKAAQ